MITYQTRRRVTRSAEDAFDVIGINVYDNHPRWEPEVVEIRRISHGPVGVGSRAVMVRRDYGRRREVLYEVTEFDPPRRIAFHHPKESTSTSASTSHPSMTAPASCQYTCARNLAVSHASSNRSCGASCPDKAIASPPR